MTDSGSPTMAEPDKPGFAVKANYARQRFYGLEFMPPGKRKEYYFLLVEPSRERAFLRALDRSQVIDLHEYGVIVACGYGEIPAELREEMRLRYNAPL